MKGYYWAVEKMARVYLPENAKELCDGVNKFLDDYFEGNDEAASKESAFLWENYCAAHRA